jgi:hypothetical protein
VDSAAVGCAPAAGWPAAGCAAEEEGEGDAMTGRLCTICAALALACAAPLIAQERFDSAEASASGHLRSAGEGRSDLRQSHSGVVLLRRIDDRLRHIMATPGRQDGLYWQGASEPLVPQGMALAAWDGGRKGNAKPYHGYYFRVLDGQGPNAPGGSHNYLVKDNLIGGFGLVAWPAEYGVTGIHTFIVNQDGEVYQKDIAPVPGKPPVPITRFDPDSSWEPVD